MVEINTNQDRIILLLVIKMITTFAYPKRLKTKTFYFVPAKKIPT